MLVETKPAFLKHCLTPKTKGNFPIQEKTRNHKTTSTGKVTTRDGGRNSGDEALTTLCGIRYYI